MTKTIIHLDPTSGRSSLEINSKTFVYQQTGNILEGESFKPVNTEKQVLLAKSGVSRGSRRNNNKTGRKSNKNTEKEKQSEDSSNSTSSGTDLANQAFNGIYTGIKAIDTNIAGIGLLTTLMLTYAIVGFSNSKSINTQESITQKCYRIGKSLTYGATAGTVALVSIGRLLSDTAMAYSDSGSLKVAVLQSFCASPIGLYVAYKTNQRAIKQHNDKHFYKSAL